MAEKITFAAIRDGLRKGKYAVFVDDKQDAELTPDYLEANFLRFVDTPEEGQGYCEELHSEERRRLGRSLTRYRIANASGDEYTSSEDLEPETVEMLRRSFPVSEPPKP